jgi:hypothetical protein
VLRERELGGARLALALEVGSGDFNKAVEITGLRVLLGQLTGLVVKSEVGLVTSLAPFVGAINIVPGDLDGLRVGGVRTAELEVENKIAEVGSRHFEIQKRDLKKIERSIFFIFFSILEKFSLKNFIF